MHPSLKNVTERAQKCDFSVNFHILIEQTGFRSDILCQKVDIISTYKLLITSQRADILCQKVDITRHCVFPLNLGLKKTFQR